MQLELFKEKLPNQIPKPKTHKPHYLLHRYWGRKPVNVINYLIQRHSKRGQVVYDPFAGSGVTIIESNLLCRKSIGIDLNPLSKFITDVSLTKLNNKSLNNDLEIIINLPDEILKLYECKYRKKLYRFKTGVWKNGTLAKIKLTNNLNQIFIKNADIEDKKVMQKSKILLKKYEKKGFVDYPKTQIMKFVKRSGVETLDELFTERNLLTLSLIKSRINKIKSVKNRNFFKLVLSSILPAASSMIPADENKVIGKSGWVISKFWKPKIHIEQNPINLFIRKAKQSIKAKDALDKLITNTKYTFKTRTSEYDQSIKDKSVDLIITDPPYGNSIAYLAISMLWNDWLELSVNYNNEIIIDSTRKKDLNEYTKRLTSVFSTCYRILKNNKQLIFSFHNRHLKYWKAVLDACLSSGFKLEKIEWIDQANSSGTQGINKKNTLKGDFIYTFKKDIKNKSYNMNLIIKNSEEKIIKYATNLLKKKKTLTMAKFFECLIPYIVNNQLYCDENRVILDLDEMLNKNFQYRKISRNKKTQYLWSLKSI